VGYKSETTLKVLPLPATPPYESVGLWVERAPMRVARGGLRAAAVGGKIYAIGGSNDSHRPFSLGTVLDVNEEYDPTRNFWVFKKPMPTPRALFAIAVYGDKIYAISGVSSEGATGVNEVYDPSTDSWEIRAPMPEEAWLGKNPSLFEAAAAVLDGKIHVVVSGGAHYAYDPLTDAWAKKAPLSLEVINALVVVDSKLYAVSGDSLNIYEVEKDAWAPVTSAPWQLNYTAAGASNEEICLFGLPKVITTVFGTPEPGLTYIYRPHNNSWIRGATMPTSRFYPGIAVIGGDLYFIGGFIHVAADLIKPSTSNEQYTLQKMSSNQHLPPNWEAFIQPEHLALLAMTIIVIAAIAAFFKHAGKSAEAKASGTAGF